MKISIITVVFNNEATIRCAIESVLNQSYPNIEYIIIDGKSEDNTVSIIEEYKSKIDYFISEPDRGLYDAMNKGIRIATGDVIGILNSDDLYQDTTVIADIMSQFDLDPTIDIVYGDLVYVKKNDTNKVVRNWKSKAYYPKFFEHGNVPPHPSVFIKKSVYDQAGLFNLDFKISSDDELLLRFFKKYNYKSIYINKLLVRMRLGGESNKSFFTIIKQNIEVIKAWNYNDLPIPFMLFPYKMVKRVLQFIS